MHKQLVHSKSDQNFFENKQIIDDISKNINRIKQLRKRKKTKSISPFNSTPSTPTSSSSPLISNDSSTSIHHFFSYLIHLLKVKRKFEKDYFTKYVLPSKISNNILITYVKEYAKNQFKHYDVSPQLIDDFDQIITITHSVTPESLFREIRTKIFVAFERVQLKIKGVHEKEGTNFSETQMSFFNSISHTIFFLLSTITYRVDYYSFTMNRLVEKLNKFFDKFLDEFCPEMTLNGENNSAEYNNCLRFIQKYIQIKLKFIDEFYREGSGYSKFNSLGRFVFNNLNEFLGLLSEFPVKFTKKKRKAVTDSLLISQWRRFKQELYYIEDSSCKLSPYFSMFFNSRLAKWKSDFFRPLLLLGEDREEICRICELKIKLYHYYLHIYFCLNYVISYQELKKSRRAIQAHLGKIKRIISEEGEDNGELCSEAKTSALLARIDLESNCSFDLYENEPTQGFQLLSLINEVMISCISRNNKHQTSSVATRSVLQFVSLLMKRFRVVVDILTLKEMRTKNNMSYCTNHFSRLSKILQKNTPKSIGECSNRKEKLIQVSTEQSITNTEANACLKSTDFTCIKIKRTLQELKTITKDELSNKVASKSKFCQSYSNSNYNETVPEATIEIYQDSNQESQNDSPILVLIPKISDFLLICPIAKGGYGRVDLYKKTSTGDVYAIKTVYLDAMQDSSQAELLRNETSISNAIDNEYIVKCYYIFCENSYFYFVTEYMPGRDLLQLLNSIILPFKTIQLIVAEILLGIEYLHSREIVHRDIKPENVVISKDGHFKLTDFGISEIYSRQRNKKYIIDLGSGLNGLFSEENEDLEENDYDTEGYSNTKKDNQGTLHYMAPECFTNDQFTPAVDFWALGVVLFELFSLKQPFYAASPQEVKQNIAKGEINWSFYDSEEVTANYTPEELGNAKDLIGKLLIKDPAFRYSDKDIGKIKSHPFFTDFNWKEIKAIRDYQVLLHVKHIVEKTNQQIKEANKTKSKIQRHHSNQTFPQALVATEKKSFEEQTYPFYYSERVDNIFKKCQETMHKIINSNKYLDSINKAESHSLTPSTTAISDTKSLSSTIGDSPFSHLDN